MRLSEINMRIYEINGPLDPINFRGDDNFNLHDHPSIKQIDQFGFRAEAVNYIKSNCSEFLAMAEKQFLYRGSPQNMYSVQLIYPPKNRYTMDTPLRKQTELDELLRKNGFSALRSNSIFCTGSKNAAKSYGPVYIVFPLNGFKFTWSPTISDLIKVLPNDIAWNDMLKRLDFRKDNLAMAIASKNEIFIHGTCLVMNYDWWRERSFEQYIYDTP